MALRWRRAQPRELGRLHDHIRRVRRVTFTQANSAEQSSTSGTYAVDGDVVTFAYDQGANFGETFTARWSIFRDALTFERIQDKELPTPYVVKTWARVR